MERQDAAVGPEHFRPGRSAGITLIWLNEAPAASMRCTSHFRRLSWLFNAQFIDQLKDLPIGMLGVTGRNPRLAAKVGC